MTSGVQRRLIGVVVLFFFVWLALLTFAEVRHSYLLADHELRLVVQNGMILSEATTQWGRPPGLTWTQSQASSDPRVPEAFRRFTCGQVAKFSRAWPSSYMWVHIDKDGRIDQTYFIRS